MKIEVNITKTRFFTLLGVILLLGLVVYVRAFGGDNPSVMGHSVGEIDWTEQIQGDIIVRDNVKLGSSLEVSNQKTITSDTTSIFVGDWEGNGPGEDGLRRLVLRAGGADRVIIDTSGNVGIAKVPTSQLDVNGNIRGEGLIIGSSNIISYVSGSNVACPSGKVPLSRRWNSRTCSPRTCGTSSCSTGAQWSGEAPDCMIVCVNSETNVIEQVAECVANSWTEAFCI